MWLSAAFLLLLQSAADPLVEGRKALDSNEIPRAIGLFQKAVEQTPGEYAAHFHLALAYSLAGDAAHAIPEYEKTLELKPGLYQAESNLGLLLVTEKRNAEAVVHLTAAVTEKPKDARSQLLLAEALTATGHLAEALPHFAETDAKSAGAQLAWGRALMAGNQLEAAAAHFQAAADIDPKYGAAVLELAQEFEKAKLPAQAIAIYRKFPQNAAAQEHLGELLLEAKDFETAVPRLEQAVAASPSAANRLALSTAYRMTKQPEKELDQIARAAASEGRNYDVRMTYGRALRDRRQFVPAANQFYAAAQLKPDSKEAWNELAAVLLIGEKYVEGLGALDRAKALGNESAGNCFLRAITLDRLKQLKPALASYEEFLAKDGGKNPDQEFQARQRSRIIRLELAKR